MFSFPPPPGSFTSKFTSGESIILDLTYDSLIPTPISASSFDFLSTPGSTPGGGHGPFKSAAHVQGIGPTDADSGWIAPGDGVEVPEPTTLWLFGAALLAVGFVARRQRTRP